MSQNLSFFSAGGQRQSAPVQPTQQQQQPLPHGLATTPLSAKSFAQQHSTDIPSGLPDALKNISPEQLALIAQLYQSGQLTLPPPPPTMAPRVSNSFALPIPPTATNGSAVRQIAAHDMDMDREEGEVEEGEVGERAEAREFLLHPPRGPQNYSPSHPQPIQPVELSSNGAPNAGVPSTNERNREQLRSRHKTSLREFLVALDRGGYTFAQVSPHVSSQAALRRTFREFSLPIPPVHGASSPMSPESFPSAPVKEPRKSSVTKRPAPARPQPRVDYVARLKAAKEGKTVPVGDVALKPMAPTTLAPNTSHIAEQSMPTPTTNPTPMPTTSTPNTAQIVQKSLPAPTANSTSMLKEDRTEEVRRRLYAIQAEKAAKQKAAGSSGTSAMISRSGTGQVEGLSHKNDTLKLELSNGTFEGPPQPAVPPLRPPTQIKSIQLGQPSSPNRFLPGLDRRALPFSQEQSMDVSNSPFPTPNAFVDAHGQHIGSHGRSTPLEASPAPFLVPSAFSAQRPPFTSRSSTHRSNTLQPKLGFNREAQADEHLVIMNTNSSDESEEDEDEEDQATAHNGASVADPNTLPESAPNPGPRNAGTAGTSGPEISTTPLGDLQQRIDEMNAKLKRREAQKDLPSLAADLKLSGGGVRLTASGKEPSPYSPRAKEAGHSSLIPGANVSDDEGEVREDGTGNADVIAFTSMPQQGPLVVTQAIATEDPEDEDDFDDVYAGAPVPQGSPSKAEGCQEDESDDSDDAMDMDDAPSSEASGDDYQPIQDLPSNLPLSLPRSLPLPMPLPEHETEQTAGLTAGEEALTESDTEMSEAKGINVSDDLAPELQPSKEDLAPSEETVNQRHAYTAYESPLSCFKDFRYHPEFLAMVPGGQKSFTYSNKIDPVKQFCPFETAGGRCNDAACQYQHFKQAALSDNELLKFLGADNKPVHDEEGDRKWKAGLGEVVKNLKQTGLGKDVAAIADRIVEYRREFVGDATRFLMLD